MNQDWGKCMLPLLVSFLVSSPLPAQQTRRVDSGGTPPSGRSTPGEKRSEGDHQGGNSEDASLRRLLAQFDKLYKAMRQELSLSEEQIEAIGELFEQNAEEMKEVRSKAAEQGADVEQTDLKALRQQMRDARAAGDDARVREIRERITRADRNRRTQQREHTSKFVKKIEEELDEAQLPKFQELLKRHRLDGADTRQVETIGAMMRAVMGPDLNLSPEQRQKIREIMNEAFSTMTTDPAEGDPLESVNVRVREAVMKELTPDQRAKLEDILKKADADARKNDE